MTLTIKQTEKTLTIENYQNKISNIPFFDVLEVLEDNDIHSKINVNNGACNLIYKGKPYILQDKDIITLEQCNIITIHQKGEF